MHDFTHMGTFVFCLNIFVRVLFKIFRSKKLKFMLFSFRSKEPISLLWLGDAVESMADLLVDLLLGGGGTVFVFVCVVEVCVFV